MNTKSPYIPRAGSLPSMCLHFFRNNPDELLTLDDITDKFDVVRGNIHTMLKPCLDADLLVRGRSEDGDYFYSAGPEIGAPAAVPAEEPPAPPVAATPGAKRGQRKGFPSLRHHIDLDTLQVEEGIPCLKGNIPLQSKWEPLFAKLAKPGQSICIPGHVKGALAAAVFTRNKENRGVFKVYRTGPDTARVWRTA